MYIQSSARSVSVWLACICYLWSYSEMKYAVYTIWTLTLALEEVLISVEHVFSKTKCPTHFFISCGRRPRERHKQREREPREVTVTNASNYEKWNHLVQICVVRGGKPNHKAEQQVLVCVLSFRAVKLSQNSQSWEQFWEIGRASCRERV